MGWATECACEQETLSAAREEGGVEEGVGGEGGLEGGGSPGGRSTRFALGVALGEKSACDAGESRAAGRFGRATCSSSICCCHSGGGGGEGGGGKDTVDAAGGGGGDRAARLHQEMRLRALNSRAFLISAACSAARARDRTTRFDVSRCSRGPSPTLPLDSVMAGSRSNQRVHVTVPSWWTRNERIFSSSANAAACRMPRRLAQLRIGRGAGVPGAREVVAPPGVCRIGGARRIF